MNHISNKKEQYAINFLYKNEQIFLYYKNKLKSSYFKSESKKMYKIIKYHYKKFNRMPAIDEIAQYYDMIRKARKINYKYHNFVDAYFLDDSEMPTFKQCSALVNIFILEGSFLELSKDEMQKKFDETDRKIEKLLEEYKPPKTTVTRRLF